MINIGNNKMNPARTLWMGNIDSTMDDNFILSLFKTINIVPLKINRKNQESKRGCCFIEFDSPLTASNVLKKYNGEKLNNFTMKLNWVNTRNKEPDNSSKRYTIYVGNLDKDTKTEDLKNFFRNKFPSVTSAKIITSAQTMHSKRFGFVDFANYQEYQQVLNAKNQFSLKGVKLNINSAKSKKEEDLTNRSNLSNSNNRSTLSNSNTHTAKQNQSYYMSSNPNFYDYVPIQMRSFDFFPPMTFIDKSSSNQNFLMNNQCMSSSFPKYEDSKIGDGDEFMLALQKGFKDIKMMYKNSYIKPQISFQCNYYCNLNSYDINEDMSNTLKSNQFFDVLSKTIGENKVGNI